MIRVNAHAQGGRAYQYTSITADSLKGLEVPTGVVSIQPADELNRTQGRCYVPTTWGTAILEENDWFVIYDVGIVSAFTDAQFKLLFQVDESVVDDTLFELEERPAAVALGRQQGKSLRDDLEAVSFASPRLSTLDEMDSVKALPEPVAMPVFKARAMSDGGSWLPAFSDYCTRYRLDYTILHEPDPRKPLADGFVVSVNATGRRVLEFNVGDLIVGYSDGNMEIASEEA